MTRRTFLQRTVQLMLGLGIMQYLPASWQQALAAARPRPALPPADGFQALVFCDSQCGGSYSTWHDTLASAWERFPQASFFTDIGDLADNGEDDWQWEQFLNVLRPFADAHPFRPVMGNHECYGQDWKNCRCCRSLAGIHRRRVYPCASVRLSRAASFGAASASARVAGHSAACLAQKTRPAPASGY